MRTFQTVAESWRYQSVILKEAFSFLATQVFHEQAYKNYTMRQLIWGYHDPMMTAAMKLLPDWFYTDFVGVYAGVSLTYNWTLSPHPLPPPMSSLLGFTCIKSGYTEANTQHRLRVSFHVFSRFHRKLHVFSRFLELFCCNLKLCGYPSLGRIG